MKKLAKIFKALSNDKRLQITRLLLKKGRISVGEIAQEINLTLKATSAHLKVLDGADLVRHEKRGNSILYSLARYPQDSVRRRIVEIIEGLK